MKIDQKIEILRNLMKEKNIDAYIIYSFDPHQSEYIADCFEDRKFMSNFTGSAGTLLILKDKSYLWTDSRYYIQAEKELENSEISLQKDGEKGVLNIYQFLYENLDVDNTIGFDSKNLSIIEFNKIKKIFENKKINFYLEENLVNYVWKNRPNLPTNPVFKYDIKYAGETYLSKLQKVREDLIKENKTKLIISSLDDIAWLFNLRGSDISYNPVFLSYSIISKNDAYIYTNLERVSKEIIEEFKNSSIYFKNYDEFYLDLKNLKNEDIILDYKKCNYMIYLSLLENNKINNKINRSTLLKSKKNSVEIENIKLALVKDGVSIVKFLHYLDENIGIEDIDEIKAQEKLLNFRKEQKNFVTESFSPISGFNEHGAIVHYSATKESNKKFDINGIYLIDSGGQYLEGTTDITRTISFEKVTKEQKRDYTLVLKGHINLALAKFPNYTKGFQLDILARKYLWDYGFDYGHGTSHGIGCFLNVHEGPQNISPNFSEIVLEKGMVLSNEPGIYRENEYGIRLENLILVTKDKESEFGEFLKFETLTLAPFDLDLVDVYLLSKEEREWLNSYHKDVFEKISPFLENDVKEWLKNKTREI